MKFHNNCRSVYVNKGKRLDLKRQHSADHILSHDSPSKIVKSVSDFDYEKLCFICGKYDNRKQLVQETSKSQEIRTRLLGKLKESDELHKRLKSQTDLLYVKAKYHKTCYAPYCKNSDSESSLESNKNLLEKVAEDVWNARRSALRNGEIFYLYELRETFIEFLIRNKVSSDEANKILPNKVKSVLIRTAQEEFTFHSKNGCPDIICLANISIYGLLQEKKERKLNSEYNSTFHINTQNNYAIFHKAVGIIKNQIQKNPQLISIGFHKNYI